MSAPEPEMNEPDDAPAEGQDAPPKPSVRQRPDWLVGAEEGVASEWTRSGGATPQQPVKLRLVKPEEVAPQPEEGGPKPGAQRLHLMGPDENVGLSRPAGNPLPSGKPLPPAPPKRPTAWTAAASSVPTIKRSAPEMPQPKVNRMVEEEGPGETERNADAIEAPETGVLGVRAKHDAPVTLAPLKESWTIVALDTLRHNTKLQIGLGAAFVLLLSFMFWPRGETGASISSIHRHPEQFDGKTVRVHGKIGDVYPIADGYTFYLLQGRDTLVVFTRTRTPVRDDHVSIRGTLSTGYLDGVAGQALFEDGKQ